MKHLDHARARGARLPRSFIVKATGRYYTAMPVAAQLADAAIAAWTRSDLIPGATLRIADPFGGDGRLIAQFVRAWRQARRPEMRWRITTWDLNEEGLAAAAEQFGELQRETGFDIQWKIKVGDTFRLARSCAERFDVVISNPPWELLKPDRRELNVLPPKAKTSYIDAMREYDQFLAGAYPIAQPSRKFAGWGTNLSRVGFEACRSLLRDDGVLAVVMPASFMADDLSIRLRRDVLVTSSVRAIAYYPAEARLFGSADVATITLVIEPTPADEITPTLTRFDKDLRVTSRRSTPLPRPLLEANGYVVPVSVGGDALDVLTRLSDAFPTWADLEDAADAALWAGREVDETGSRDWLATAGPGLPFIKGRMIGRFVVKEAPTHRVGKANWVAPPSTAFTRIGWRDVSRPSQKRRVIATLLPPGVAAGNSLGVAYFKDGDQQPLHALLGVMSSLVFEFQLRCHLATGHVSLSSLRKVRVPPRATLHTLFRVSKEVAALLADPRRGQARLEALVATDAFGLCERELVAVMGAFPGLSIPERREIVSEFCALAHEDRAPATPTPSGPNHDVKSGVHEIPNHVSARLSELDLRMVRAVPQGGNWKDIPESIPSKRLEQIRASFRRGEGSRSTYYGRLRADRPSYTINTYFNRPGNGCHVHPCQDRVISQREAARLQSFPDSFRFVGPQTIVNKQIGNAVPPMLAYQIAGTLGTPGIFVDLFSGAGGLGLGFRWAGWRPLVANDIEPRALQTYARNVHDHTIVGSLGAPHIRTQIVDTALALRHRHPSSPLWVLGGPPCQGFSTAGRTRTMDDERNHLFGSYCEFLEQLRPDGFVFENVTGLLNMRGGAVFEMVKEAFNAVMPRVEGWLLSADNYAVPQRRRRVFLVGATDPTLALSPPPALTGAQGLPAVTVEQAIGDLPALSPSQNGSSLPYTTSPQTSYQALMRGILSPSEYLDEIRAGAEHLS